MGGRDAHIGHQAARQLRHITHHNRVHRAQMVVHRTAVFDLYFAIVGRKLADERGDVLKYGACKQTALENNSLPIGNLQAF